MSDEEKDGQTKDRQVINLFQNPMKLSYIEMDEEDAQTDTEIQNEKQYVYAETGNDKRELPAVSGRKAFKEDKSGDAENKRGEQYAGAIKDNRNLVFFCEWLEIICFAHGKVYHRKLFFRRWDVKVPEIY